MKFEHNICGFFDVSGFYNGKCWLPREGALLGSTALSVFNLDHGQKLDCLSDTAKSNAMMTMERIGMSFEPPPKSITVNLLSSLLSQFYQLNSDEDKFLVTCKHPQAELILRDNIPRINFYIIVIRMKICSLAGSVVPFIKSTNNTNVV